MSDELGVSDVVIDGVRVVHLLRYGSAVANDALARYAAPESVAVRRWQDADLPSIHHFEMRWAVCGMVTVDFHVDGWLVTRRRLAEVGLARGALRDVVHDGMMAYLEAERRVPMFAWVQTMPPGRREFTEFEFGKTIITMLTEKWVPQGVMMLGNGGGIVRPAVYVGTGKPYMEVRHE